MPLTCMISGCFLDHQNDQRWLTLPFIKIICLFLWLSLICCCSLNNLSQSCRLMRDICLSLLNERGLVIIEWVRYIEDNKIRWKEGKKVSHLLCVKKLKPLKESFWLIIKFLVLDICAHKHAHKLERNDQKHKI